nr:hypothetical protein [uncultured Rhodopila sp.]
MLSTFSTSVRRRGKLYHDLALAAFGRISDFCSHAGLWRGGPVSKEREAEFTTYATVRTLAAIDSGAGSGGVWDYNGVMQSANGDGPFNNMTARCLQNWTNLGEQFHIVGSCVLTDIDGDTIFDVFEGANSELTSGTGKYKGIIGRGSITRTRLHDLAGGDRALVNHHKVSWEIK